jgi:hypothetical protein
MEKPTQSDEVQQRNNIQSGSDSVVESQVAKRFFKLYHLNDPKFCIFWPLFEPVSNDSLKL